VFSLIITIVSIALVAALAIATIYYGGQVSRNAKARADAAAVTTQAQQILGAAQLFRTIEGRWPSDLQELVAATYLDKVPSPPLAAAAPAPSFSLISSAHAAVGDLVNWETVQPTTPYYWVHRAVPKSTCQQVNMTVRGDDGIYNAARPSLWMQCFGENEDYTVVVGFPGLKNAPSMEDTIGAADPDLDVDESGGGWAVQPSKNEGAANKPPIAPSFVNFDTIEVGDSAVGSVTFTNHSKKEVVINGITGLPSEVSLDASTGTTCGEHGITLPAGTSCTLDFVYVPTEVGAMFGSVTVSSNYVGFPSATVTLSGSAVVKLAPISVLDPTVLNFGTQELNTSVTQPVTVSNGGTAPMEVTTAFVSDKTNYSVLNECTTIPAGASCNIQVTFTPRSTGAKPATLTVGSDTVQTPQTVNLTGTSEAIPRASYSKTVLQFANRVRGSGGETLTTVVKNTGSGTLAVTGKTLSDSTSYTVSGCAATLAPGGECTLSVTFAPTTAGNKDGQLAVVTNASSTDQIVELKGLATEPVPPTPSTWEPAKLPKSGAWYYAAYGAGKFYLVGRAGSGMMESTDGVNYTWSSGWGNASHWSVGSNQGRVMFASNDWSTVMMLAQGQPAPGYQGPATQSCCEEVYSDEATGKFHVIALVADQYSWESADGRTFTRTIWPDVPTAYRGVWREFAANNGVKLLSNQYFYTRLEPTHNAKWSTPTAWPGISSTVPSKSITTFGVGGGRIIAIGRGGAAFTSADDGKTWIASQMPTNANYANVVYGDGTFVAVGHNSADAAYSKDGGLTWTHTPLPQVAFWTAVSYGQGKFVAYATNSDTIAVARTN